MTRNCVQSLWIGGPFSTMERLSVQSFLNHGYDYHLYLYDNIANVPQGVTVKPAADVLPRNEIFVYRHGFGKGSPSAFSNLFRYTLLLQQGGWWVDADVVCLRPLEFTQDHVFGYERTPNGSLHVGSAVMKMPAGSPVARYCFDVCQKVDRKRVRWGEIGPKLVQEAIHVNTLTAAVLAPEVFYPFGYEDFRRFIEPGVELPTSSVCAHLWHAMWKKHRIDPNLPFRPDCLYENWKRTYLGGKPPIPPAIRGSIFDLLLDWATLPRRCA